MHFHRKSGEWVDICAITQHDMKPLRREMRMVDAQIMERQKARETYEQAKKEGKTAALGAVVVPLRPSLTRAVVALHRPGPLSPAAAALVLVAWAAVLTAISAKVSLSREVA